MRDFTLKTSLVSIALILPLSGSLMAQPITQEWVARYDGPVRDRDDGRLIAVDNSGNVYVSGQSTGASGDGDIAVVKYDSAGNELWVRRYNGPDDLDDYPYAMTLDSAGNVCVTGERRGALAYEDIVYVTIKYDPAGSELWVRTYDGPVPAQRDIPVAIAADHFDNVYVTGQSYAAGTGADFATIKYDSQGNTVWEQRHGGPSGAIHVEPADMVVDVDGNVYVTGRFYLSPSYDFLTVKYDTSGNELWSRSYDGFAGGMDTAMAVAVDAAGNVFMTGASVGTGVQMDILTIKYDSAGNLMWASRYDPYADTDVPFDLAVGSDGSVYVTGYSTNANADRDYLTIKYDPDGNEVWAQRYNGPGNGHDYAYAIALDSDDNVYITGDGRAGDGSQEYVTIKYDSAGNQISLQTYNAGTGDCSWDYARAIAVDEAGSVYVTGSSCGPGTFVDFATIKYSLELNLPPVAVAGPDHEIHAGELVDLNGTGSYDDNTPMEDLGFAWTFVEVPAGSTATLSGADTVTPSFVADLPGTYRIHLVVTDAEGLESDPNGEWSVVTVSSWNLQPKAYAGPDDGAVVGDIVWLNGSGYDPEGNPLTYAWTVIDAPDGSTAALSDPTVPDPSLTPDVAGQYTIELVVNDGFVDSDPDTVVISAIMPEDHAQLRIMEALGVLNGLCSPQDVHAGLCPAAKVTSKGNQTALANFLTQAIAALQEEPPDLDQAIFKLNQAIERTDGCVLRGEPDGAGQGRDWITDCAAQIAVYEDLANALSAISE